MNKDDFICGLNLNSIKDIEKVPKSDLHSHAGRGGTISYIEQWANVKINPPTKAFNSLEEMNGWLNDNVKCYCLGVQGYIKRIEAAFAQAKKDNITVLAMSYSIGDIDFLGGIETFIEVMDTLRRQFAPDTAFFPDFALGYNLDIDEEKIGSMRYFLQDGLRV